MMGVLSSGGPVDQGQPLSQKEGTMCQFLKRDQKGKKKGALIREEKDTNKKARTDRNPGNLQQEKKEI